MLEGLRKNGKMRGDLFDRVGRFLDTQGLDPNPANYAIAYAVIADPSGALAMAVARLTDGGVRLGRRELAELGGAAPAAATPADPANDRAQELVAETQAQVDGFATMMRSIHAETRGFGRDLAQSAAMMQDNGRQARGGEEIARLASAMVARVRDAETRLARATEETDTLRTKLAEARDTARRDPLTGLPNRRALDEAFAARAERAGPYALAICDIDHFKRLNDRHGHPVGDRVLRAVAQELAATCDGQFVVRYGGEEFAVLVAGADLQGAAALLDRARAAVAAKRFRNRDTDAAVGQVTFSAGVTGVARGEELAAAVERADRLLYTAKAQGRDRICTG